MKIFVLGCGHMGSVLSAKLAETNDVMVWDPDVRRHAPPGAIQVSSINSVKDFKPNIVLNCASLSNTTAAFDAVLPMLHDDCMLADIASVKGDIPSYYARLGRKFVSTHPMFGPTFADPQHLAGQNAIIIAESDEAGKSFFQSFFGRLEVATFEYSFEEHDKTIAYSLSTPFASTLVFAACMQQQNAPGTTFRKHLEIARGLLAEDDFLLSEILFSPHTLDRIERINQKLTYLTHIIRARDYEEMSAFLNRLRGNIAD